MKTLSTKHNKRATKSNRKTQRKSKKSIRKNRRSRARRIGGDTDSGTLFGRVKLGVGLAGSCGDSKDPKSQIRCEIRKILKLIAPKIKVLDDGAMYIEVNQLDMVKINKLLKYCINSGYKLCNNLQDFEVEYYDNSNNGRIYLNDDDNGLLRVLHGIWNFAGDKEFPNILVSGSNNLTEYNINTIWTGFDAPISNEE
jgi:hypothetical protein